VEKITLKSMHTAMILARMYGVGECLNQIPYKAESDFIQMITSWSDEYLQQERGDLVDFFEMKMQECM
jgi:hypothetical protein